MVENHDIKDNKSNNLKLPNSDIGDHEINHGMVDQKDPSEMIFFTENDLKVGNKIPIYFPKNDPSRSPHLLPRDEASSIPFSSKQLPNILNFFSFPQGSPQAKAMEYTIGTCEAEPIKGETKFCATSLESMLDFVLGVFGSEGKFGVVSTTLLDNSIPALQNYTVLDSPEEISAPKMVACHTLPYPYAVYYCHCQESENKVYKVSLGGEIGGVAVEAVAVCHADGVDICAEMFDGDPMDNDAQSRLDYSRCFAFKDFKISTNPSEYEISTIDIDDRSRGRRVNEKTDFFLLFDFSAKWDWIPTMLTQNHTRIVHGFMGQTTAFRRSTVKTNCVVLAENKELDEVRYLHGEYGKGTWTFLGGHDPEDYRHFIGDPPTDLSLYPNSPGYRLILNNILFPAAKKEKHKT